MSPGLVDPNPQPVMKKVLYIFGAGASKDFGLPLGNEVFEYAHKLIEAGVADELRSIWDEAAMHLQAIFSNLPADKEKYPLLEEVLTLLWEWGNAEFYDYKA